MSVVEIISMHRRMDKVRQEVVKLPTAFDTEKVIEELKSGTEDSRKIWHRFGDEHAIGEMSAYIRAISKKNRISGISRCTT
ncbi:MAG: hypothetical protein ACLUUO_05855 [Sellimonas intestinalis]